MEQYGDNVLDKNGKVDRKKVGEIVFSNREEMNTLAACAWEYMKNSINKILEDNKNVVLDWVLLPETHYWDSCNYTILMTSDDETRIKRVMERDNITREYCLKRDDSSPNYVGIGAYSVVKNNYTVDFMKHPINTISTYIRQNYFI